MRNLMRLLRSYVFWSYERGSIQYDVMVTAILLFLFVGPRFINFKDKPSLNIPLHSSEVLVKSSRRAADGNTVFTYEIRAEDVGDAVTDSERIAALRRVIEPISGEVTFESYKPVTDAKGNVYAYDATVRR